MKIIRSSALVFIFYLLGDVSGANILILDSMGSPSHHLWMKTLSYALAESGHNVTSLSSYIEKTGIPANLHYLFLEKVHPTLYGGDLNILEMNSMSQWEFFKAFKHYFEGNDLASRESRGFQQLLDYPKDFKFDLIIIDILCTPSLYIFMEKFKGAPVITASAYPLPNSVNRIDGVPYSFSIVPHELLLNPQDLDGMLNRLKSFFLYVACDLYDNFIFLPTLEKEMKKIIPEMRSLTELMQLPQLHLVNYNTIVDSAQPIMPNVISVGGLQIREPKEIPEDLQNIYEDKRTKGVVIFSLGTNIKPELLGKRTIAKVLKALGKFKDYNFIWKINLDGMKDLKVPRNVFTQKWLPQNDLLSKARTKLFISHAGGLSLQETIWYGVPMLCIPGFFDQFPNCDKAVKNGIAQRVDIEDIDDDDFEEALEELLSNSMYRNRATQMSKIFRDQPQEPLDRALWWVEYILRNPDVTHLRNPRLHEMDFFVKHSFDVILVLTAVVVVSLLVLIKIIICVLSTKKPNSDQKVKRN